MSSCRKPITTDDDIEQNAIPIKRTARKGLARRGLNSVVRVVAHINCGIRKILKSKRGEDFRDWAKTEKFHVEELESLKVQERRNTYQSQFNRFL